MYVIPYNITKSKEEQLSYITTLGNKGLNIRDYSVQTALEYKIVHFWCISALFHRLDGTVDNSFSVPEM